MIVCLYADAGMEAFLAFGGKREAEVVEQHYFVNTA